MTATQNQINDWADDILNLALPHRKVRAASPPRFVPKPPKPAAELPVRPSYVQRRPALLPTLTQRDYDAMAELLSWSQLYASNTQDASHTVTWSWCPLDGLWYVWTTRVEAEGPSLADVIGDVLAQLEPMP